MRYKKILISIVSILAVISIALFVGEIALRICRFSYCPLRLKKLGMNVRGFITDYRMALEHTKEYFIFDPYLIWRPKTDSNLFNRQGFRGPEVGMHRKSNEYYIFTVGDSNTLGSQSTPGWPSYLGELFKEKFTNVKVINAGVWGYSSFQGLYRFREILQLKPNIVLISFGANDAAKVTIPDRDYVRSTNELFKSKFANLRLLQLFLAVRDRLLISKNEEKLLVPRVDLKEYRNNLSEMIRLAQKNDIKIIFLTRPFRDDVYRDGIRYQEISAPGYSKYNEVTVELAKERGILLIDLYSYFQHKDEYFCDPFHFNDNGYRIAAEIIYKNIKDCLLE